MGWFAAEVPEKFEKASWDRRCDICRIVTEAHRKDFGSLANGKKAGTEGEDPSSVGCCAFGKDNNDSVRVTVNDGLQFFEFCARTRFSLWMDERAVHCAEQ